MTRKGGYEGGGEGEGRGRGKWEVGMGRSGRRACLPNKDECNSRQHDGEHVPSKCTPLLVARSRRTKYMRYGGHLENEDWETETLAKWRRPLHAGTLEVGD